MERTPKKKKKREKGKSANLHFSTLKSTLKPEIKPKFQRLFGVRTKLPLTFLLAEATLIGVATLSPFLWGQFDSLRLMPLHIVLWLVIVVVCWASVYGRDSGFGVQGSNPPIPPFNKGGSAETPPFSKGRLGGISHFSKGGLGGIQALDTPNAPLVGFFLLCLLSLVDTVYLRASLIELLRLFDFAIVFLLARLVARWEGSYLRVTVALTVAAAVAAVIGIRQYVLSDDPRWRTFGTFFNPNIFAGYLGLTLFPTMALALIKPVGLKMLPWVAGALIFGCLGLTGSKGGFIGVLVGIMVFIAGLFVSRRVQSGSDASGREVREIRWFIAAGAFVCLLLIVSIALLPPLQERFLTVLSAQKHSWMFRLLLWKSTWDMLAANWLNGTGLGTFEYIYPHYAKIGFTRMAHNSYLQIASECGWLATLMLLTFMGLVLRRCWRALRTSLEERERYLLLGALGGVTTFLVHNLVDYTWFLSGTLLPLAMLMGMLVGISDANHHLFPPPHRWRVRNAVLCTLLSVISITFAFRVWMAEWSAMQAGRSESLAGAERSWRQAIRWEPWCAAFHVNLARVLELKAQVSGEGKWLMEAVRECEAAIRLQPTRAGNYKLLGDLWYAIGQKQETVQAYKRALIWNPYYTEVLSRLAQVYEEQGQRPEAEGIFRQLAALEASDYERYKPVDMLVDLNYARAHVALGRYALKRKGNGAHEAIREFLRAEEVVKKFQRVSAPLLAYADEAISQHRNREASELLEQAYTGIVLAYERIGREDKADEYRKKRKRERG